MSEQINAVMKLALDEFMAANPNRRDALMKLVTTYVDKSSEQERKEDANKWYPLPSPTGSASKAQKEDDEPPAPKRMKMTPKAKPGLPPMYEHLPDSGPL